jgi:hypothetical protein
MASQRPIRTFAGAFILASLLPGVDAGAMDAGSLVRRVGQ